MTEEVSDKLCHLPSVDLSNTASVQKELTEQLVRNVCGSQETKTTPSAMTSTFEYQTVKETDPSSDSYQLSWQSEEVPAKLYHLCVDLSNTVVGAKSDRTSSQKGIG